MPSETSSFLADWSCEQALIWIVMRDLAAVLQANTWQTLKVQQPSVTASAEASLLQQLRAMSIISAARCDELDLSSPGWRQRDVAVERNRWPDCYAHPEDRFSPSQVMGMFPSECAGEPRCEAGRVSIIQIALWMACQHSVRSKIPANLGEQLEDLLLAYSRSLGDILMRAWRGIVPVGEPGTLSPETMAAFLNSDVSFSMGDGFLGSGMLDGCSILGDKGVLWSRLHFLEHEIMPALRAYDFSCSFSQYASTRAAQNLFRQSAPQAFRIGEHPHRLDRQKPQSSGQKRGAPRFDDTRWLLIMRDLQREGMTENASAVEVVRRHDREIVGASVEAKKDRLRRKSRELR